MAADAAFLDNHAGARLRVNLNSALRAGIGAGNRVRALAAGVLNNQTVAVHAESGRNGVGARGAEHDVAGDLDAGKAWRGFAVVEFCAGELTAVAGNAQIVGRATATYFVLLDVGVGIGPYTLGLLVPYFGFSAVYFAAASVAAVGILIYWAVIGRTGIFSTLVMRKVRSVRLNQIEIDPRDVSSAYRRGEEIEFDDPQPNQKKDA